MRKILIAALQVVAVVLVSAGTQANCDGGDSQKQNRPPYEACYEPDDNDGSADCEK